jgi:hypothetical protein
MPRADPTVEHFELRNDNDRVLRMPDECHRYGADNMVERVHGAADDDHHAGFVPVVAAELVGDGDELVGDGAVAALEVPALDVRQPVREQCWRTRARPCRMLSATLSERSRTSPHREPHARRR